MTESYFKYWGKARRENEEGAPYHLLPYHCLDVAAVAEVLLARHGGLRRRLCKLSGLEEADFLRWVVFFLAIHDLGKFSESFQNLRPDLLSILQGKTSARQYAARHDTLGYAVWQNDVRDALLGNQGGGRGRGRQGQTLGAQGLDFWAMAVMGHHGLPPKCIDNSFDFFTPTDTGAVLSYIQTIALLFLGDKSALPKPSMENSQKFSWWLSGFSVLCDWLGSNADLFQYRSDEVALSEYWEQAKAQAEHAVSAAELLPAQSAPLQSLQSLFKPAINQLTPLQQLCSDLPIGSGAQLFILEDVTGAGKTEASIMLLHRLLANGAADGVYFALPTMATANAMYERMSQVYARLYDGQIPPSLVLSHGARDLSDKFRQSIVPLGASTQSFYGDDTTPASAHCGEWLADNRKKALLAEVGVGTIDQCFLALLPSKHQSLRMLGLLGKVLVVDEVHACDAYMNELLCAVLKAHASVGGSAILLSATLPAQQRQKLLNAFNDGAGVARRLITQSDEFSYPLLSHSQSAGLAEHIVETRESVKRKVSVELISDQEIILNKIDEALASDQCICWIRNTVDDARDAYALLQQRFPHAGVDLFHARFAMGDRLAIEARILEYFGKDSTPECRRGRVLIATQVVEQSLDLDFDVMITDLAPIDLILQRAGRLCRHTRDAHGARVPGPDQRGRPTLLVHSPNPSGEIKADWFKDFFKRAAGVYPHHGQLWLTAKLLVDRRGFRMPEDARLLIEGVYASDDYPVELESAAFDAEGEDSAKRGLAVLNALDLSAGYGGGRENRWWEETSTPTRLGEEMIVVYLTKWDGQQLSPWINEGLHPWPNSAIQIRKALATAENNPQVPEIILDQVKLKLPAKGQWSVLLVLEQNEDGDWLGSVVDNKEENRVVRYSVEQGLRVE